MESDQLRVHCEAKTVHEAQYTPDSNASPVEAVAQAIAAVEGVDPMDLTPLYDHVDVEAINRLVTANTDDHSEMFVFGFTLSGWQVFIRGDGQIRICDGAQQSEPSSVFEPGTSKQQPSRKPQRPQTTD